MNRSRGWSWCGLALLGALAAGCGSERELKKFCIPGVDCEAIDTIRAPPNCTACADCADNWGICAPGGVACKRDFSDLDPAVAGCESLTGDARGQWVMHSTGHAVSFFSFNGGVFQPQMSVSVVAFSEDDPNCVPSLTASCGYTVHALQFEIPDFEVPESSWSDGVATLNGPLAASDDGTGTGALAPMLFAFDVQHQSKRRIALSSGFVSFRISRNDSDPALANIQIQADSVDFGGYVITHLSFDDALTTN